MRSATVPRRVLFFATLIAAGSLADPAFAQDISINLGQGNGGVTERAIQLIALLTVLSIAPSILIMMTSFTRIVVVLSLLRTALGTATAPPNSVIIALAMFLTAFVMGPVLQKSYDDGIKPLVANQISVEEALQRASVPLRGFMQKNVREKDLKLFMDLSGEPPPATPEDMSLRILVPAFMISELKRAFEIGFLLFLPFLIIDLVVASVLMSMGMMMLPPVVVSLPFKLIFFVLVDGWSLVAGSLVQSYGGVRLVYAAGTLDARWDDGRPARFTWRRLAALRSDDRRQGAGRADRRLAAFRAAAVAFAVAIGGNRIVSHFAQEAVERIDAGRHLGDLGRIRRWWRRPACSRSRTRRGRRRRSSAAHIFRGSAPARWHPRPARIRPRRGSRRPSPPGSAV